ncbi:cytochrome C oxidase subunit IV family protein [Litoribacillus peritrichatus]|uniref:Cytochrome c oxidase subunit IV n=1 Tax=Litoribacillus peritrichatus TaxID=718191 RepID=A0ABP7MNH6_9GAMM
MSASTGVKAGVVRDTLSWLVLISLTVAAIVLGQQFISGQIIITCAVVITALKGIIVSDVYMGLMKAPKLWRRLMLSYVILIPGITGAILLIGSR